MHNIYSKTLVIHANAGKPLYRFNDIWELPAKRQASAGEVKNVALLQLHHHQWHIKDENYKEQ